MPTARRSSPYLWTTWLTPILAADAQCLWAVWFQANHTFDKIEDDSFDLRKWKVQHAKLVDSIASELSRDGWTIYLEDQNKFTLKGIAATLAGKPDIVAVRGDEAKVIDAKTGKRRDSDVQQVLIYMMTLPMYHAAVKGKRLAGEVAYADGGRIPIQSHEFTKELRDRILATIMRMGHSDPPSRVPSASECSRCKISKRDCADRVEVAAAAVTTSEF